MAEMAGEAQAAAAGRMREQAEQAAGRGLGRARVTIRQRAALTGEQVNTAAQEVRTMSAELRARGRTTPANLAEQGADRLNRVGERIKTLDADQLVDYAREVQPGRALHAVESFGRKRPVTMLAGGLALGFLPSRLLKAWSGLRYQTSGQAQARMPAPVTPTSTMPEPPPRAVEASPLNAASRPVETKIDPDTGSQTIRFD